MENRSTRRGIRAFPPDFEFTQDPKDDLRKLMDIPGRHVQLASEFIASQLDNMAISTADPNEPSLAWTSGHLIPLDATVSGNLVEDLQDIASQRVTGFDLIGPLDPGGLADADLRGVSYSEIPTPSGDLHISVSGIPFTFTYDWDDLSAPKDSGIFGVTVQDFLTQGSDEYIVIQKDTAFGTIAVLRNIPRGTVVLIDSKNLQAPWDPSASDGLIVDPSEIQVSGDILILTSPRPSFVPAILSGSAVIYPPNYQPDQTWNSSFIAEYEFNTRDAPYGLSQEEITHNLGRGGDPIGGADTL